MEENTPKADYSVNLLVLYVLIILTIGEFVLGVIATSNVFALMMLIAVLKAGFIIAKYMNIGRLFQGEEESHE
jgi:hypothetical protein